MPGFVGYTERDGDSSSRHARQLVRSMQKAITHLDSYRVSEIHQQGSVTGALSQVRPIPATATGYAEHRGIEVWATGECFRTPVSESGDSSSTATVDTMAGELNALYRETRFAKFGDIDGLFAAVIYDASAHELHLVTDRYGFEHLYVYESGSTLAWATEVKAFLPLSVFDTTVKQSVVTHFVETGRLHGDETWFPNVTLVEPGTVRSYDLTSQKASTRSYWTASTDASARRDIDVSAAAEGIGQRFESAVRRRVDRDCTHGLGLSGGLDSRAILAALPSATRSSVQAFTFGMKDSADVRVARDVADTWTIDHSIFEIDGTNWFEGRPHGAIVTDGQVSVRHMHSMAALPSLPERFDINLNGFLGDAFLGGMYLSHGSGDLLENLAGRGRRLINMGVRLFQSYVRTRRPFFDRDLVDYCLSLPKRHLQDGRAYHRMLVDRYTRAFAADPIGDTGLPLTAFGGNRLLQKIWGKAADTWDVVAPWRRPSRPSFHDYPSWLADPTYHEKIEAILLSSASYHPSYLSSDRVEYEWNRCRRGASNANIDFILRVITLEIWLSHLQARTSKDAGEAPCL